MDFCHEAHIKRFKILKCPCKAFLHSLLSFSFEIAWWVFNVWKVYYAVIANTSDAFATFTYRRLPVPDRAFLSTILTSKRRVTSELWFVDKTLFIEWQEIEFGMTKQKNDNILFAFDCVGWEFSTQFFLNRSLIRKRNFRQRMKIIEASTWKGCVVRQTGKHMEWATRCENEMKRKGVKIRDQ